MNVLKGIWEALVNAYMSYSAFIHSIFPSQLGDLVVYVLDIVAAVAVIKIIASFAFSTKSGD